MRYIYYYRLKFEVHMRIPDKLRSFHNLKKIEYDLKGPVCPSPKPQMGLNGNLILGHIWVSSGKLRKADGGERLGDVHEIFPYILLYLTNTHWERLDMLLSPFYVKAPPKHYKIQLIS